MAELDLPDTAIAGELDHIIDHNKIVTAIQAVNTAVEAVEIGLGDLETELLSSLTWPPDVPPNTPSGYNYEFTATTTSLPTGWSWVNQGGATYTEKFGRGYFTLPASSASTLRGAFQSFANPATYTVTAKLHRTGIFTANYGQHGIAFRDSVSTKVLVFWWDTRGLTWARWTADTLSTEGTFIPLSLGDTLYMRVVRTSPTNWDLYGSTDGAEWAWIINTDVSAWLTPNQIGIMANTTYNRVSTHAVEFFRVT